MLFRFCLDDVVPAVHTNMIPNPSAFCGHYNYARDSNRDGLATNTRYSGIIRTNSTTTYSGRRLQEDTYRKTLVHIGHQVYLGTLMGHQM